MTVALLFSILEGDMFLSTLMQIRFGFTISHAHLTNFAFGIVWCLYELSRRNMDSLKVQIQLEVVADIGEEIFLFFFLIIVFVNVRVGCIWFISSKKKNFFFFLNCSIGCLVWWDKWSIQSMVFTKKTLIWICFSSEKNKWMCFCWKFKLTFPFTLNIIINIVF